VYDTNDLDVWPGRRKSTADDGLTSNQETRPMTISWAQWIVELRRIGWLQIADLADGDTLDLARRKTGAEKNGL
jgi:hypothetical protein